MDEIQQENQIVQKEETKGSKKPIKIIFIVLIVIGFIFVSIPLLMVLSIFIMFK